MKKTLLLFLLLPFFGFAKNTLSNSNLENVKDSLSIGILSTPKSTIGTEDKINEPLEEKYACTTFTVNSVTTTDACEVGKQSTVTINSTAAGLPVGTYTVEYRLSYNGYSTVYNATMTVSTAGTGQFIANQSIVNITSSSRIRVDKLTSGSCTNNITSNNVSNVSYMTPSKNPPTAQNGYASCNNWIAQWNNDTVDGYYLDVAIDNTFTTYVSGYQNLYVGNVISYTLTGLARGGTYYYRVRSVNYCGISGNSNVVTFTERGNGSSTPGTIGGGASSICVGANTTFTISGSNPTSGTWSIFNQSGSATITQAGVVTGTAPGTVTVVFTNGSGCQSSTTRSLTISGGTVTNASSTPTVCMGTALTPITHTTTGFTGIGTPSNLPAGVNASFNNNVITINGTPTVSGTFNYSIPLTGGSCGAASTNATGTITVTAANSAGVASSSPTICINTALTNITHSTTGATGISNSSVSGANGLPAGVSASWASNTITISGTPTTSGTFNYSIPLTGGCGTVNATGRIIVNTTNVAGPASSSPTLCINTALTNITHSTTGATGISNNGVSGANGLPAGVSASWASNTITISGTPTASGTFNYSIPLTGGCGTVNATGTITVTASNSAGVASSSPTLCINTTLTNITHSTARATGISNNGVNGANGLPAGVSASWASNTITISGTPTTSGTFNYSIPLTGGCGTVNATGTITVTASNSAGAASSSPTLCINTALTNITHSTTGATGISNNGVAGANGLPAGVSASWVSNVITISGTPTASGTFNYSIPLTGGCGSVNATGRIIVNPNTPVSVTISHDQSSLTICQGTHVRFTATPVNGGTSPTYQWYNGATLLAGQTANSYLAYNLTSTDDIKVVMTSNATSCVTGNPATSNSFAFTVITTDRGVTRGGRAICAGTQPNNLTLVNAENPGQGNPYSYPEKVLRWEYSDDNNATWNPIAGTANLIEYQPTELLYAKRAYRAVAKTDGCPQGFAAIETSFDIKPLPTPTFTASASANNCTGTDITYTTQSGQFVYLWTISGTINTDYTIVSGSTGTTSNTVTLRWLTTGSKTVTVNYKNSYNGNNNAGCYGATPASSTTNITQSIAAPTITNTVQPTCSLPTGSITVSGLPASGTLNQLGSNGASNSTYTITGSTMTISGLAAGDYRFGVNNTCTVNYSVITTITPPAGKVWNGSTSTSWNTPSNWTPSGVPTATDCVEIPNVTVKPLLAASTGTYYAYSLTVNDQASLTVGSNNTMQVTNAVTVLGTGQLVFENNSSLIQTTNATNNGYITYKRNTQPVRRYDFTYWSTPVTGADNTLHNLSPNTLLDKYYSYDAAGQKWVIKNYGNVNMEYGVGYIVRAPQSYSTTVPAVYTGSFIGTPNNGPYTIHPVSGNWNLIGNPYPSALDAEEWIDVNHLAGTDIGALYFWTHNSPPSSAVSGNATNNYTSNDYAVFSLTGSVATTSGAASPNGYIAAGQGFFIQPAGNSIVFNNSMRVGGNNAQFFKTAKTSKIEKNRLWLNFTNAQGAFKQALIGYVENATNGMDTNYDALTMAGNSYIDFYSINDKDLLTIQARALPFDKADIVPLGYKTTVAGNFTIGIDHTDGFFAEQAVYLEDKKTGTIHDLRTADYTFTTAVGTFADRFALRYTSKTLGTGDFENIDESILIAVKDKTVSITSTKENIKDVLIYNIGGQEVYNKKKVTATELQISNLQVSEQVLLAKVTLENGHIVTKKIIFR